MSLPGSSASDGRIEQVPSEGVFLARSTLERLYDGSPEPVAVVEPQQQRLMYCNQTFVDLCGLRPRAVRRLIATGARLTDVLVLEGGPTVQRIAQRAAELGQSLGASSVRGRVIADATTDLVLTVTASPIDSIDELGPAVVVTFRNGTAEHRVQVKYQRLLTLKRKHAEELESRVRQRTRELAQTQDELLQATRLAAVGEVAGAAAHEVFNPLTAVTGNLETLRNAMGDESETIADLTALAADWSRAYARGGRDTLAERLTSADSRAPPLAALSEICAELEDDLARRRRILDMVCRAGRRIERIIHGMLGMARAEAEPEVLNLHQVFREVRDLMAYSFDRAGVRLDVSLRQPIKVYVDRGELLQVLTNLIRNACQAATAAHGATGGQVSVIAEVAAHDVSIKVEDNGVGVPEDMRARIFDAGFTTKPKGEGSGLGLPISRRLIRRNGGELELYASRPGSGTTMRIRLPLATREAPHG